MQNSKCKVQNLRKRYSRFIYENYSYKIFGNDLKISFGFRIEPDRAPEPSVRCGASIYFKPKVVIENIDESQIKRVGKEALNNLVFHLGLIELLSYWKATCSPEIEIRAGFLNKKQIAWWKNLIMSGMGQFFYENKIDFTQKDFLEIKTKQTLLNSAMTGFRGIANYEAGAISDKVLVPVGGGKDSAVTLELLKREKGNKFLFLNLKNSEIKNEVRCFSLNPTSAALEIMKIADCKSPIMVKRKIDKKLLELNRKGFLNGHTPFSAYLAFLSVLAAVLFGYKYIAVSNERSSNEGNLKYLDKVINHQYSKSFDFEKKFRDYSKKYLTKNTSYFSFLRPLYEIQIAKLFSQYPKYFSVFLSCNEAYKTFSGVKKPIKKWCGKCPKCLFTFIILYPFFEEKKILKIFGENLFANKKLLPIMQQLIGERGLKPFECVGTKKESILAFYLSWKKYTGAVPINLGKDMPFLLRYFEKKILPSYSNLEKESSKIMNSWAVQNYLPKELESLLIKTT